MRERRVAAWTVLVAALLAAAGALLPVPPELISNQLDAAFGATLHFGAAQGYRSGTRLISTFGPLGFVFYAIYFPATYAWLLGLRAFLAAATCWSLAWLGGAAWGSPWGAVVALLACVPFLASPDVWFLTLPLLALLIELPDGRPAPPALRLTLGAAIGLASLIKFTFLLAACAVFVPLLVLDLIARRVPILPAAVLVTAALAWVIMGYGWGDALGYLDWSVREISAGYSRAMQIPADPGLTLHAVGVSAVILVAGGMLTWRQRGAAGLVTAPALAALLFLLFKAGFVRFDVHVYITIFGLVVLAILLAVLWVRRPAHLPVAAVLVALLLGGLFAHAVTVLGGGPLAYFRAVFPGEALRRLAALPLVLGSDALAQADVQRKAALRAENPLPRLSGPIDIYPTDQALLLAHDLEFRPRPVLQSYMAYSPRLARANADFLLDGSAPEWILFRVAPIDQRLPALDDAPSWPLLMTRYRFVEPAGPFALLQRRATPLPWRLEALARAEAHTGDLVNVPPAADGPIWARVDVHETPRDAVVAALLAGPVPYIGIGRADGQSGTYRLVPALAREGFLLSPVVDDTADFMRLLARPPDGDRGHDATAITVQVRPAPGIAGSPRRVDIEFYRLVIDQ